MIHIDGHGVEDSSWWWLAWKFAIYKGIAWTPIVSPTSVWLAMIGVPEWKIEVIA